MGYDLGKPTLAYNTLKEICNLSAFSLPNATRKKLNQYAVEYTFNDDSTLRVYTSGRGESRISKGGLCDLATNLRVNKIGGRV